MSDSRLEKFIYAICSMDVSDLPVPLSRIEKLWNCLITGETPDFEPLSRNEKYLMAMLDRYDISNLPAPMSRGEQLLYKIAVGETDLSDVPGYLSRYEELLKYLIENGGISGGDFEYVLYTLNQSLYTLYTTAEKPVKSAILKGQTLVNLVSSYAFGGDSLLYESRFYDKTIQSGETLTVFVVNPNISTIKVGLHNSSTGKWVSEQVFDVSIIKKVVYTVPSNSLTKYVGVVVPNQDDSTGFENGLVIVRGDQTHLEVNTYFEGMQSVKMPVLTTTGKNLVDTTSMWFDGYASNSSEIKKSNLTKSLICKVKPNTTYTFTRTQVTNRCVISSFKGNHKDLPTTKQLYSDNGSYTEKSVKFTTLDDTEYVVIYVHHEPTTPNGWVEHGIYQLEEGSIATEYEPHKSNILTVNEDVTLCGIGDIRDTLDCLTGEVTERIGEVVLDGSEGWWHYKNVEIMENTFCLSNVIVFNILGNGVVISNSYSNRWWHEMVSGNPDKTIGNANNKAVYIIDKSCSTLEEFTNYLQQRYINGNPVIIQYPLSEKSIKTVDLTVVDQDNQPTELGTFENVTHVSLEAENLIPEVEMEVATNLLEDTVFNLTSAFNTLYPTAEKPVKSAILSGNTKLVSSNGQEFDSYFTINDKLVKGKGIDDYYGGVVESSSDFATIDLLPLPKPPFIITGNSSWKKIVYYDKDKQFIESRRSLDGDIVVDENPSNAKYCRLGYNNTEIDASFKLLKSDGSELDYPNLELISVKMPVLTTTGKNLFDGNLISGFFQDETLSELVGDKTIYKSIKVYLKRGTYTLSFDKAVRSIREIKDGVYYHTGGDLLKYTFTTETDGLYGLSFRKTDNTIFDSVNIQLEEGTQATAYEPYKTNILTTNEEVELRKVGDVQDELNLLTGELTQRIGKVVLDGSDDIIFNTPFTGVYEYVLDGLASNMIITIPETLVGNYANSDYNGYYYLIENNIRIIQHDCASIGDFKQWLSQNPITIQYQLTTESIKTVDLTVVDQDNQPTQLGTFENLTHVLLDSEGLIPTASLTVRTKIPSASSTSLLMDDILTNQQQLEATVDEQSENADATMIATTEIFEETL